MTETSPQAVAAVRRTWRAALISVCCLSLIAAGATALRAQTGYPGSLRWYSDHHKLGFRIGTAVILEGGGRYNGYHPAILSTTPKDVFYQAMVRDQFNQIQPENELKMGNVWTGGAKQVNGKYAAITNLFDQDGPLNKLCTWAEGTKPRMAVRGHVMVYNPGYTIPRVPSGQLPLFTGGGGGFKFGSGTPMKLAAPYTPQDLRDMLESYVRQVVDATLVQNAISRLKYHYKVVDMWDVTNEVVADNDNATPFPGAGFAYRPNDFWYNNGPSSATGFGYDYVPDIYNWAADEMRQDAGKTIIGDKITDKDRFELYYNDYNLEWDAAKAAHAFNVMQHARAGGGEVDGLGMQGHITAYDPINPQCETTIKTAIADHLHFAVTELDVAVDESAGNGHRSVPDQLILQGQNYGAVAGLCVKYQKYCDCLQIWGASDDGSWLANQEATPITRWVADTRPGPTKGQEGYWPKEGQFDPTVLVPNNRFGGTDPAPAGRNTSDAYDELLRAIAR